MNQENKMSLDELADRIFLLVKNGTYRPGTAIREAELCEYFGVSRTPIREALRIMENNGLLIHIPGKGVQVVELTMKEIKEITDIRLEVEKLSTREATKNVTDEDIQMLRRINQEFLNQKEPGRHGTLDTELHKYIAKISGNKCAIQILENLIFRQTFIHTMIPFRSNRVSIAWEEHEKIIDAMEMRNPDLAEKCAEIHFRQSQISLLKKMKEYQESK